MKAKIEALNLLFEHEIVAIFEAKDENVIESTIFSGKYWHSIRIDIEQENEMW